MENFNGEKFPECVKILLEYAAYDKLNSLNRIDAAKITEIEEHLTNHRSWMNNVECCNSEFYKNLTEFHFLPGHKAAILGIPQQIKDMGQNIGVFEPNPVNAQITAQQKERSDDELINILISNLKNYMKKNHVPVPDDVISSMHIHDFERGSEVDQFICKCRFSCPFCEKIFPLSFKKFWMSSNITKHFKNHIGTEYIQEYIQTNEATEEILF